MQAQYVHKFRIKVNAKQRTKLTFFKSIIFSKELKYKIYIFNNGQQNYEDNENGGETADGNAIEFFSTYL